MKICSKAETVKKKKKKESKICFEEQRKVKWSQSKTKLM